MHIDFKNYIQIDVVSYLLTYIIMRDYYKEHKEILATVLKLKLSGKLHSQGTLSTWK